MKDPVMTHIVMCRIAEHVTVTSAQTGQPGKLSSSNPEEAARKLLHMFDVSEEGDYTVNPDSSVDVFGECAEGAWTIHICKLI